MSLQDILNFEVDANILHTLNSPSVYHLLGHENVFMSDKEMKRYIWWIESTKNMRKMSLLPLTLCTKQNP